MRRWFIAALAVLLATVALARSEGIYNPSSNAVGDYQGIDSNKPASGSTLACSYSPVTTGTQSVAYTGATPAASGGTPAYTFSETGALPTGLTINTATGVISGTPSVSGTFAGIQVAVADTIPNSVNCGSPFTLVISAPAFQGPGDVVSGALIWGSCARVYSSAIPAGTSMCDLVDSAAPTVPICTLKSLSTSFVDLASASCTGAVTPATKCSAATGGLCNVSKVYDQIGGTSGWINATAASQPVLTFSALNGLPGWTCTSAANKLLATTTTFTQAQPFTFVAVGKRTANFTSIQTLMGWTTSPNGNLEFTASANTVAVTADAASFVTLGSVTDNAFHALQGVSSGASSVIAADGVENTGTNSATAPSANLMRLCRFAGGSSLDGTMMEAGFWPSAISSGNRTSLNSNIHGTNGYNF